MARVGLGRLSAEMQTHLALLVHPGVILRDLPRHFVAHQVAARVADMRDDGLVVAQRAGHQRGGHLPALVLGLQRAIVHGGVGHLTSRGISVVSMVPACALGNSSMSVLTGRGRGNLAEVHAAHAVGNREEIAVGAGLLARGGDERTHRVLIVGADFAEIADLRELYVEHGCCRLEVSLVLHQRCVRSG